MSTPTRIRVMPAGIPKADRRQLVMAMVLVVSAVIVAASTGSGYWIQVVLVAEIYLIAASFVGILRADANQISFGHGAIFGAAAYLTAMAAGLWGWPFPLAVLVGLGAGCVLGCLFALPALRVQGYYLGFVTLGAAIALPEMLYAFSDQTSATTGISLSLPGFAEIVFWRIDWLMLVVVLVACVALLLQATLRHTRFGRNMRIAGESSEAAQTLGIWPGRYRFAAFLLTSAGASVAGVLYVPLLEYVSPGAFGIDLSVLLYFIVIVGGTGSVLGVVLGVVLLYVLPNAFLADAGEFRLMTYGAIALLIMSLLPDGLMPGLASLIRRFRPLPHMPLDVTPASLLAGHVGALTSPSGAERGQSAPILSVRGVSKSFGSVVALSDVSIDVNENEVHAIVGANGSGKTTLLNAISGLLQPSAGTVQLRETDITRLGPTGRAVLGFGRTFQTPRVFDDISLRQNVDFSPKTRSTKLASGESITFPDSWESETGKGLTHVHRRMLEVLRVVTRRPTLIALDEPAAGLSRAERAEFSRVLTDLVRMDGVSVVLVEHDLDLVWSVADRVTVMALGQVLVTGTPEEVAASSHFRNAFGVLDHA